MAKWLTRIPQSSWHAANCKLCGGKIAQEKVDSYGAIRTLPGQEQLEDEVPALEDSRLGRIRIGTFVSLSRIRSLGTLPGLYLFHRICYAIVRHVANCDKPNVSLLTLVSVLAPTTPVNDPDSEPLSKLDGDTLATIFNRPPSQLDNDAPSQCSDFRELLFNIPPELLSLIMSNCAEHALAVTVGLTSPFFDDVVRHDFARQRIAVGIQVARLLQNEAHDEVYTEKKIKLSSSMTAVFVPLPGGLYLQAIQDRKSRQSSENCIDFSLDADPEALALQVDHLGIRNIAFELDKYERPMWLRDERSTNVFVDKSATGSFSCLRTVSDPIKIRMMDIGTPDRTNNPHPRALLPRQLGIGVPYSVRTVRAPYMHLEGYFEASYIEFSVCTSIYLPSDLDVRATSIFVGISGIFDTNRDGREEIHLGSKTSTRSVRMFGLQRTSSLGGHGAFLQIQDDNKCFIPPLPDLNDFEILDEQEYIGVKGIWWGAANRQFYFNVVY